MHSAPDVTKSDVNNALREMKRTAKALCKREGVTYRALFARMDMDNDDRINFEEFMRGMKTLFHNVDASNPKLVLALFDKFNLNNDSQLDYVEFKQGLDEEARLIDV